MNNNRTLIELLTIPFCRLVVARQLAYNENLIRYNAGFGLFDGRILQFSEAEINLLTDYITYLSTIVPSTNF